MLTIHQVSKFNYVLSWRMVYVLRNFLTLELSILPLDPMFCHEDNLSVQTQLILENVTPQFFVSAYLAYFCICSITKLPFFTCTRAGTRRAHTFHRSLLHLQIFCVVLETFLLHNSYKLFLLRV